MRRGVAPAGIDLAVGAATRLMSSSDATEGCPDKLSRSKGLCSLPSLGPRPQALVFGPQPLDLGSQVFNLRSEADPSHDRLFEELLLCRGLAHSHGQLVTQADAVGEVLLQDRCQVGGTPYNRPGPTLKHPYMMAAASRAIHRIGRMSSDTAPLGSVEDWWSTPDREPAGVQWVECEAVHRNLNWRGTGDTGEDWLTHTGRFLAKTRPRRALSIGCGFGIIERLIRERNICDFVEGIDVAPGAIEGARRLAAEANLTGIEFNVMDLESSSLPEATYDAVYAHASLHHVFNLEHVLDEVRKSLKPNGVLFVYEYVGPSRMQFPNDHIELADSLLKMIPREYRRLIPAGGIKNEVHRLPLSLMIASDPSEAIRAPEIVPMVADRFKIEHFREVGGTLLMQILHGIAGNFRDGDPIAMPIIDGFIKLENWLLDTGTLPSYHAYVVARRTDQELLAQRQSYLPSRKAITR